MLFTAAGSPAAEAWITDGTAAGTLFLAQGFTLLSEAVGDMLFSGGFQTDGTQVGTGCLVGTQHFGGIKKFQKKMKTTTRFAGILGAHFLPGSGQSAVSPPALSAVSPPAFLLDARIAFRFSIVVAGAMLANGRRTAASWFRCAGVRDDWDRFYELLQSIGKNTAPLVAPILRAIVRKFDPGEGEYWKLAIDDSPTQRFGRHVEAANIHHNPTPGPGDGPWLYGHNWGCLAMRMKHSRFGVIALPLLSRLYVRKVDVAKLKERYGWKSHTQHQLALDLLQQVMRRLRALGSKAGFLVVFDRAYAARELIRPLLADSVVVVTRFRRDAKLFDLPVARPGQRDRPRKYGKNRISLAKRAGQRRGWQTIRYACRGVTVEGRYKTFMATSHIDGGAVRVVLLKHTSGNWAAYISTDQTGPFMGPFMGPPGRLWPFMGPPIF